MYDHTKQYRCTIIRGKSQKEMDDFLPIYAKVINDITPCSGDDFEELFNNAFKKYLPADQRIKKTLDNHRTEISGSLFGMYFLTHDNQVFASERTLKYLEDNDQPAFFKDICYKAQFPNASQKISTTVADRIANHINIRPNSFVIKLLLVAKNAGIELTVKDIGYYVLNSLDVLQGNASPFEVIDVIEKDKKNHIERDIKVEGKASSYSWQHIREQLNYLELANLIRVTDDKRVVLNQNETDTINLFADDWDKAPIFDVYKYPIGTAIDNKYLEIEWSIYFSKLSDISDKFTTTAAALVDTDDKNADKTKKNDVNLVEFGDEGEALVYEYEKKRVSKYNPRLVNKVLSLGKTKGIGYDIQSVVAEPGDNDEFVKYIEVKSTKRLTCPDVNDNLWIDTINITRNEWIAAQQHKESYSIFRVYFTRDGVFLFVLNNPYQKFIDKKMTATPMTYRVDFASNAVDSVVENLEGV